MTDFKQLYSGHALLVKVVGNAAVFSHVLYLWMQNCQAFLGAQDLTPRIYLVFCFGWAGQISWCLRWDLQWQTAAPRYCSQYFFFFPFAGREVGVLFWASTITSVLECACSTSPEGIMGLVTWERNSFGSGLYSCLAGTSLVHAPFQHWAELSIAMACSQGSHFIRCFTWCPNSWLLVSWPFRGTECGLSWIWMFLPRWAWRALRVGLGPELCSRAAGMQAFTHSSLAVCVLVFVVFMASLCYLTTSLPRLGFQLLQQLSMWGAVCLPRAVLFVR